MMKRLLMVFLLLIMLAGCVKSLPEAEKPVESPDIVQSDIPEEQGKPEVSAAIKKIDETKDWAYIKEDLQIDFKSEWDYPSYFCVDNQDHMQIQIPVFNVDTEDVRELNNRIEELQRQRYKHIKYRVEYSFTAEDKIIQEYTKTFTHIYISDDYATITITISELTDRMNISYEHYTVRLKTGEVISNQDLLNDFDINLDTLEETIQSELLKSEYRECEGELYDGYPAAKFCYLLNKLYPLPENAFLYVNDNNQLVYNTMNQGYTSDGILGSFFIPIIISSH
ncbi:MAG TPA: hypothetical protein DCM01_13745 [Dielma fastidiosa]|nr:hypothetical protein [Dielma fastidiosa]